METRSAQRTRMCIFCMWYNIFMNKNPEEEYSGFKTLGTDIDEAYSGIQESDTDDVDFDLMDDEDE